MADHPIIVQKYGGACLETPAKLRAVAQNLADLHASGHRVVVVVSAMGKTTDQLVEMAYQVSPRPNRRELDMLLTTGERVSMSLMSMALSDLGVPAISFTGSQAGVMTDASHSAARIVDVRPLRVREELDRGRRVHPSTRLLVTPASQEVALEAARSGILETLLEAGAHVTASGCGACPGGHGGVLGAGEACLSSTNRNFRGRMGSADARVYLGSPASVAAAALSGRIVDPRDHWAGRM